MAYSRPGRMRAAWAYFAAWPQTASDFAEFAKTRLTMPVLSIAGEKASAGTLNAQMTRVATNLKVISLKDTGHWVMEERPKETMEALVAFLGGSAARFVRLRFLRKDMVVSKLRSDLRYDAFTTNAGQSRWPERARLGPILH